MSRRLARETALKIMFQVDVGRLSVNEAIENTFADGDVDPGIREFAEVLVRGAGSRLVEIDRLLSAFSVDWQVERMANIDRNILRLAVFELLLVPDVPASVTVNEAVELAKRYGDDNSPKFVNGILGNMLRQLTAAKAEAVARNEVKAPGPPAAEAGEEDPKGGE